MTILRHKAPSSALSGRVVQCVEWLDQLGQSLLENGGHHRTAYDDVYPIKPSAQERQKRDADMQTTIFAYSVAALGVKLMQVDGIVNAKEHRTFVRLFTTDGSPAATLRRLLAAASKDTAPALQYARQLARLYAGAPDMRRQFILRLTRVALADGPLVVQEYDYLYEVARELGYTAAMIAEILDAAHGAIDGDSYRILSVESGASNDDVHRAYVENMRFCHPDRWSGKPAYKEMWKLANARASAINQAYVSVAQSRGMALKMT